MPSLPLLQLPRLLALAVFLLGGFFLKTQLAGWSQQSPALYSLLIFVLLGLGCVLAYRSVHRKQCPGCGRFGQKTKGP